VKAAVKSGDGLGKEIEFYKSTIKKNSNLSPYLSYFLISYFLSYDPRGKPAGENCSSAPIFVVGFGNQGLAICISSSMYRVAFV
jgi:hypothetical protein